MRIRYNPEARPELAAWEYYIDEPEKLRGHWAEQFARRQPMVLELGCGKGGFLAQMAPAHPEKNYIALDVKSEMLVLAKRKAEEAYAAAGVPMDNFLMTAVDIERIFLIMDETDQFDEVYINFCPPCPKCRQHKHRLTHPRQLERYQKLMAPGARLYFKTDDDDLFRDMCEKEGYDWRLISAIAYSESRFNPYVVSRKGAKGLMQVMPRVARQFGVQGDLMDPENNVLLALKVLGKIEKSLDFAPGTSSADRMKIVLACYNAGLGHVLDARSLARKYGANPDSWSDVSTYLSLKSDPEVVKDDAVKCGRFNSSQTLAFVNKVFSKYTTYCNNISR